MTIHLPEDLENSIRAEVLSGHFASEDAMVEAAVRAYFRQHGTSQPTTAENAPDPILGLMRDDAELMDEIAEEAYRHRREDTWREIDL